MKSKNNNSFEVVSKASKEFRKQNPVPNTKEPWNHGLNPITMHRPEKISPYHKPSSLPEYSTSHGKVNGANIITK